MTLTFQFQAKKGEKLKLHSERGEEETLYIVDETRENFLYAMPVDTDEQLQYRITFPAQGTYKLWGTFYINGKKYEKDFIVQVQKEKTAKFLAVFSFPISFVTESIVIGKE